MNGNLLEGYDCAIHNSASKFDGRGRYFFANGDRYEGEFSGGQRSGEGIMFFTNGGYREGRWENDRPVGEVCADQGLFVVDLYRFQCHVERAHHPVPAGSNLLTPIDSSLERKRRREFLFGKGCVHTHFAFTHEKFP